MLAAPTLICTEAINGGSAEMSPQEQKGQLLEYSDLLKLGLAGHMGDQASPSS